MQYARKRNDPEQEIHRRHSWNPVSNTRDTSNTELVQLSTPIDDLKKSQDNVNEETTGYEMNRRLQQQWSSIRRSFGGNEEAHGLGDRLDVHRLQVLYRTFPPVDVPLDVR